MRAKSTTLVIRPVPDWRFGDWFIALCLSIVATAVILINAGPHPSATPGSSGFGAIAICFGIGALIVPLGLAIRHAGSVQFSDEGIVLTRLLVPYRRVAWREVRSAYLRGESDGEVDRRWRQVFLVLRGGRDIRFPIAFPEGRHSPGDAAYQANELFLRQMANRRIVVDGLEALDRG